MDYSSVTTGDLHSRLNALTGREIELERAQEQLAKEAGKIHGELRRRRVGTTDDRVEWQEVGLR